MSRARTYPAAAARARARESDSTERPRAVRVEGRVPQPPRRLTGRFGHARASLWQPTAHLRPLRRVGSPLTRRRLSWREAGQRAGHAIIMRARAYVRFTRSPLSCRARRAQSGRRSPPHPSLAPSPRARGELARTRARGGHGAHAGRAAALQGAHGAPVRAAALAAQQDHAKACLTDLPRPVPSTYRACSISPLSLPRAAPAGAARARSSGGRRPRRRGGG